MVLAAACTLMGLCVLYRAIGQVDEDVLELVQIAGELFGAQPCEALRVDESLQRLHRFDADVYPEIELVSVEQQRVLKTTARLFEAPKRP